jgi:hypothetical protein
VNEFWVSSGHLLLDRSPDGFLLLTDDFLRAFLARPELMPPEEACDAERALHATLLAEPRADVDPTGLADADAVENWTVFLAFRDALIAAPTIEAAYLRLATGDLSATPPLFMTQLVHVILRNALHDCTDAATVRAAELLFRPQRVSRHDNTVLLADAEAIESHEQQRNASPLLAMLAPPAVAELTVLTEDNAADYWGRSDAFDMVLNLGGTPGGRDALGRALRIWVRHMLGFDVQIDPLPALTDPDWRWFIGLDTEATRIGNALWAGDDAPDADRLLALFRLVPEPSAPIQADMRGRPIYLMLAANADSLVRLKPHNLLTGLPMGEVVG